MATAREGPSELAKCPICLDQFTEPKVLACLHSFCEKCLEGHIKRTTNRDGNFASFRCPVCRAVVNPQGQFRTPSDLVRSLKTNHIILSIMEKLKLKENSSDLECNVHPGKYMEYFCESHFDMICANCAVFQHRGCEGVISLNDASEKQEKEVDEFLETVKDYERWADVIICDRQRRVVELGAVAEDIRSKAQSMQQTIYKKVDEKLRQVFEHVGRLESNEKQKYQQQIDCCQQITDETRSSRDKLQMAMEEGNRNRKLRAMIGMRHMTHFAEASLKELSSELSALELEFVPDEGLEQVMDGLQNMGDLIVRPIAIEVENKPPSVPKSPDVKPLSKPPTLPQIELQLLTTFQVESKIDKCTPYISGLVALEDGRLLIIDQFNSKVSVLGRNFEFVSTTSIRPLPYAATEVSRGLVAVSIPKKHKVQLVKIEDQTIKLAGFFDTGGECYGIAYRENYFVCCPLGTKTTRLPSVVVFSKMGEMVTIINKTQQGENIFCLPYFISLNGSDDPVTLYVSDMERQSVISVTAHGERKWEWSTDLVSPRGVATVGNKVYVASWKNEKIVEIAGNGETAHTVISKELECPFLVCIGRDKKLFVSQFDGTLTDETEPCVVKVYRLG